MNNAEICCPFCTQCRCSSPASPWRLLTKGWFGALKVHRSPGVTALSSPAPFPPSIPEVFSLSCPPAPASTTPNQQSTTQPPLTSCRPSMSTWGTTCVCTKSHCLHGGSLPTRQPRLLSSSKVSDEFRVNFYILGTPAEWWWPRLCVAT